MLSHPDTLHLGALPYAMKQLGLSAPVYATEPVHRLGLLTMYDQYLSRKVKFLFFRSLVQDLIILEIFMHYVIFLFARLCLYLTVAASLGL